MLEADFAGNSPDQAGIHGVGEKSFRSLNFGLHQSEVTPDPASPSNQIRFKFAGGTNLDPAKDMHMHEGTLTFVDADHITFRGVAWSGGKPTETHCDTMKLVSKK